MTLEQYRVMAKAWEFGGRPIVHDVGKMNSRHFAWTPRRHGRDDGWMEMVIPKFGDEQVEEKASGVSEASVQTHSKALFASIQDFGLPLAPHADIPAPSALRTGTGRVAHRWKMRLSSSLKPCRAPSSQQAMAWRW